MREPANASNRPLRFAWLGRVSTEDQQDPTLSLPRQLRACRGAIPDGSFIVAHFYDVESGRRDLDARGRGDAHAKFDIPIPRDGGVADLLAEAQRPDCRFDAVICEAIDRVARTTYDGTRVERRLERAGVVLVAADEPMILNGKRSTAILNRRVKQGIAEWYVLDMLERSWDGFCEHTRQGWNIGAPPYGYTAEKVPHPVPAKRAEGKTKTRLVLDLVRASVVQDIFTWRVTERIGYATIAARLNADPEHYPPPVSPDPARTRTDWSRSSVRDLLQNPKYTGYMVWNRRARTKGGKINPESEWVWSEEPTHEPIITRETFEAANGVRTVRERTRNGTSAHPATRSSYPLRSFVRCACGRRMNGKTCRKANKAPQTYYVCQPDRGRPTDADDHARVVYVRQDDLMGIVLDFFATRLFGPERSALLEADLRARERREADQRPRRDATVRRRIEELAAQQARLLRAIEREEDGDGTLFARLRERFIELEAERATATQELAALESVEGILSVSNALAMLDRLPIGSADLARVPESSLRRLFHAFQLQVHHDAEARTVRCRVSIGADMLDSLAGDAVSVVDSSGDVERLQIRDVRPAGLEPATF